MRHFAYWSPKSQTHIALKVPSKENHKDLGGFTTNDSSWYAQVTPVAKHANKFGVSTYNQ